MPKVSEVARITVKDGAVWRRCAGCGLLVALAPDIDRCDPCASNTPTKTAGGQGEWSR